MFNRRLNKFIAIAEEGYRKMIEITGKNKLPSKFIIICIVMGIFVSACTAVPLTGRMQLAILPDSQLKAMGITAYRDFLKNSTLAKDEAQTRMVQEVGSKIAAAAEDYLRGRGEGYRLADFNWEFNLIEDKTPNAWAMPGGKIAVYTGILPYTKTPEGLAVVISHEIAHVVARHGNERMSQAMLIQAGGLVLQAALGTKTPQQQQAFLAAYGLGANIGISLPFSRAHEYEADHLGLIFMGRAGYDPNAASEFWKAMTVATGEKKTIEYLSTHPSDEKRLANIRKIMPEARQYYRKERF